MPEYSKETYVRYSFSFTDAELADALERPRAFIEMMRKSKHLMDAPQLRLTKASTKAKLDGDAEEKCPICKRKFAPQGITGHVRSCARKSGQQVPIRWLKAHKQFKQLALPAPKPVEEE